MRFATIVERLINRNSLLSYFSSVLVCVIALPNSGVSGKTFVFEIYIEHGSNLHLLLIFVKMYPSVQLGEAMLLQVSIPVCRIELFALLTVYWDSESFCRLNHLLGFQALL